MSEPEKTPEIKTENKQPENPTNQEQNPHAQEQNQNSNPTNSNPEPQPQQNNQPQSQENQNPPTETQNQNPPTETQNQNPPTETQNQNPPIETQNQNPPAETQNQNPPIETQNQNPPAVTQNQQNEVENQNQEEVNEAQQNEEQDKQENDQEQIQQTNPEEKQTNLITTKMDKNAVEREKKKFSQGGIEDIQHEIQEITKKIEHERINLRITTERLTQKEKTYNELQGKPVQKTKEEIEKERRDHRKAVKNHKLSDPIIRKKGKEKEFYDEQVKNQKAYDKNKTDFEKLTTDINELVIGNKDLKQQIIDLRKRKVEAEKQLENIMEENRKNQEELDELLKDNKSLKDQIKYKEYKKVVEFGNTQEKNFIVQRDDYEDQYHELIKNYVRREKETKKENAKKRQMALLGSGSNAHFKGMSDKDIEKQIKLLAEEEISDRTPILDIAIEKWTEINKSKKITIERHFQNCVKIEEAFKKLTNFLGLDNFSELPTVFRKTEQQMSNINFYNEKLDLQIDELEMKRDSIIEQIKLLSEKKTENVNNKSKFKEQKEKSIEVIKNLINNFSTEMEHKKEVFKRIQPMTDKFLSELGESYLSDFVPNRTNVDKEIQYNEQTVNKFLSNVQDYYKLIQAWDESNQGEKADDNRELDKLREEMKAKLGGFEKNRIISKKLINNMKSELKSGVNIEEIIKKTSLEISNQQNLNSSLASNPYKTGKKEHNNSSMMNNSQLPTQDLYNNPYGNDSGYNKQSSIMYPNNSSSFNNNSSANENKKVPENA